MSFWTKENEQLLAELWGKKLSAREIAAKLGCTRNAVIGKAHRLDLAYRAPVAGEGKGAEVPTHRKYVTLPRTERTPPQRPDLESKAVANTPENVPRGTVREIYKDLRKDSCRWVYGDPSGTDFGVCTSTKVPDKSYCATHAKVAYKAA